MDRMQLVAGVLNLWWFLSFSSAARQPAVVSTFPVPGPATRDAQVTTQLKLNDQPTPSIHSDTTFYFEVESRSCVICLAEDAGSFT